MNRISYRKVEVNGELENLRSMYKLAEPDDIQVLRELTTYSILSHFASKTCVKPK